MIAQEVNAPDERLDAIRAVVRALPEKPGIYIFKNESDEVLYIVKDVKQRSRVRSYFG